MTAYNLGTEVREKWILGDIDQVKHYEKQHTIGAGSGIILSLCHYSKKTSGSLWLNQVDI